MWGCVPPSYSFFIVFCLLVQTREPESERNRAEEGAGGADMRRWFKYDT